MVECVQGCDRNRRDKGGLARAFARAAAARSQCPRSACAARGGAVRRIGELLGLTRRAGQAVAGFEKAREWLRSGRARLVLQASDGSEEERARFLFGSAGGWRLSLFAGGGLGRLFGRDHVVHVAIAPGDWPNGFTEADRLAGLRGGRSQGPARAGRTRAGTAGLNEQAGVNG